MSLRSLMLLATLSKHRLSIPSTQLQSPAWLSIESYYWLGPRIAALDFGTCKTTSSSFINIVRAMMSLSLLSPRLISDTFYHLVEKVV